MSATDELRRLLDERGVEYRTHGTTDRTWFEVGRISWFIYERENGNFTADAVFLTPAQAIAATLGDVPRLPHFWTHDGTLHVELPRLPESISVRLPDQRDREVGSARTWQYTQGSGTCRYEIAFFGDGKAWFACSECGGMASADYDPPKYCPHCGRKVVDE